MKKLLGFVIALIFILTTVIGYPMAYFDVGNGNSVEAASNYSKGYYKVTPSEGLNLRKKATTSSKSLTVLSKGTRLKVTKVKSSWGYTSHGSKKGWVSLRYAKYLGRYLDGKYKVTPDEGLCLRKGHSTSTKKLTVIPHKTVVTITRFHRDWGRTSYKGKTGWVSMEYVRLKSTSIGDSDNDSSQSTSSSDDAKYKVIADVGLCLRKGRGTSYDRIAVIPYKKVIEVTKIKNGWARTTYRGKTGWAAKKYLKKVSEDNEMQVDITKKKMLSKRKVYLKWKGFKKATKYRVYRSKHKSRGYECIRVTKRTHITNSGLAEDDSYYYKVRAYRGKKKYGDISDAERIYTGSEFVDLDVAVRSGKTTAKLNWNEEKFVTGYIIFRSSGNGYKRIEVIRDKDHSSYKDKGLDPDERYSYKIRSYRRIGGETYYSNLSEKNEVGKYEEPSKITISNVTKPSTLRVSQAFTLKGKIKSEYKLKKVYVGICTTKGKWKKGMHVTRKPGKKTFKISSVDALIKFDELSSGTYRYKVKAVDSQGYSKRLVYKKFTVKKNGKFIWPCGNRSCITSYFGYRAIFGDYHPAIDIGVPTGTKIHASRKGTVIVTQSNPYASSYGKYVIVEHSGNYQTLYAHCSALKCSVGDTVSQGETIALVGMTGNATGPHLHFEVRYNGVKQNPLNYLP